MTLSVQDERLLRELLDREAIRQSLAELAAAVDRVDEHEIARHYTAESHEDHADLVGSGDDFAHRPSRRLPSNLAASHFLCQDAIYLQGDEAYVEKYFHCPLVWEVDGRPMAMGTSGRYHHRMVRIEEEWKVAFRRVLMDSATEHPFVEWREAKTFRQGKRFPDDSRYHREDWRADAVV